MSDQNLITVRVTAMKDRGFYARHAFQAASVDAARELAKEHNWDNELFEPTGDWVPVQSLLLETDDEERLVDLDHKFQLWRFHHLKTVERIIGYKPGTGGTGGVSYLAKALELKFFPELWQIRTSM